MSVQRGPRQSAIRAIPLICLLCATAGSIDAIAYLRSSQVFVANMTGNTVLLAISLLQHQFGKAALRGGLIAAFFLGVVVSRLVARISSEKVSRTQRIALLGIQSVVLLLLAWKGAAADARFLLLLLAIVLGVQNAAFQYIGIIHLNTAFITGDLEKLGEAVAEGRSSLLKVSTFLLSWVGYLAGGLFGALGAFDLPSHAFFVPVILTALCVPAVMLAPENAPGRQP